MLTFIGRRLLWGVAAMLLVGCVAFVLTFLTPADPARSIVGPNAGAEAVERARIALGLDRPVLDQLLGYLGGLARGDLGVSWQSGGRPVLDLLLARLPATIQLAVAGVAIGLALGIPMGVSGARHRGSVRDRGGLLATVTLIAIPSFLLAHILRDVFAYRLAADWDIRIFPLVSRGWSPVDLGALALPALTIGLVALPVYARLTRTLLIDELGLDHVRTARAKGLSERRVVWRHGLRSVLPAVVIAAGLDLGVLLGGVVVVESVFGWPGIGAAAVESITSEDLPLMMGTLLVGTFFVVVANLLADLAAMILDPRIAEARVGKG